MKRKKRDLNLRRNLIGGISSTILALPESIAYGTLIMVPLGARYLPLGVIAGLLSLVFLNLGSAITNRNGIINGGPFSLSSLMLASTMAFIIEKINGGETNLVVSQALIMLFLVVFLAGSMQVLFGVFRIGNLTKYIPYPVVSGLLTGTAILIFISQLAPFTGIEETINFSQYKGYYHKIQPYTLLCGLLTIISILLSKRVVKKIPPPFTGIFVGTLFYHLFTKIYPVAKLGPVIGKIPSAMPGPDYLLQGIGYFQKTGLAKSINLVVELLPYATGIAILLTLRTLIAVLTVNSQTLRGSDSNRELIGEGLGNMVSSFFGGISGCGSISRSLASYNYGSTNAFSKISGSIFALSILMYLHPVVSLIPRVVLAGMLIMLSVYAIDSWIIKQLKLMLTSDKLQRRESAINVGLVATVVITMITVGIFEAVGIGIAASVFFFVLKMKKNVILREYSGTRIRSYVERTEKEISYLVRNGRRIKIIELQGTFFFGTADALIEKISYLNIEMIKYIIIDFRRITGIDTTGARVINLLKKIAADQDRRLLISDLDKTDSNYSIIYDAGICYDSLEDAMAWVENDIISQNSRYDYLKDGIALKDIDSLAALTASEHAIIEKNFKKEYFKNNQTVFREGNPGDKVYYIVKGKAHIFVKGKKMQQLQRMKTLCPGTIFGEMALITGKKRSATVISDNDLVCYTVDRKTFDSLTRRYPKLGYKILTSISMELAKRIRVTNDIVSQLKE
jgi:SulP family sulfate permease